MLWNHFINFLPTTYGTFIITVGVTFNRIQLLIDSVDCYVCCCCWSRAILIFLTWKEDYPNNNHELDHRPWKTPKIKKPGWTRTPHKKTRLLDSRFGIPISNSFVGPTCQAKDETSSDKIASLQGARGPRRGHRKSVNRLTTWRYGDQEFA